jgi:hypothetical protein
MNSSWQILTFSPRIVVFIRICGTHNTANEVFHCVHFECPCPSDVLQLHLNDENSSSKLNDNGITYDEYSKYLSEINSASINDKNSFIQTHKVLPFTIKSNSSAIFNETNSTSVMEF